MRPHQAYPEPDIIELVGVLRNQKQEIVETDGIDEAKQDEGK